MTQAKTKANVRPILLTLLAADTAVALIERTGHLALEDLSQAQAGIDEHTAWALFSFVAEPIIGTAATASATVSTASAR